MIDKNLKGYTLVEALISVLILAFILLGVYGVLQTGNTIITNDNALLEVQQQGRNAMDRMVREVRASSSEAITVINANSDKITFTTPNETGIKYYLNGANLAREYPAGTVVNVANSIGYLKFTVAGSLLTINVRADKALFGKTVSFSLVENVRLRNE